MNKILLFIVALGLSASAFSQDIIILNNGFEYKNCRITREDSLTLYFNFTNHGRVISTRAQKELVKYYAYNYQYSGNKAGDSTFVSQTIDKVSLGLGLGLEYGGIGGNLMVYPAKGFGLFGGIGYAIAGAGYNVGVKIRTPGQSVHFFVTGMYGYFAAIKVQNADEFSKIFYGPSAGIGLDFGPSIRNHKGYFTVSVLVPFNSSEVDNYIEDLKTNHNVEMKNELLPFRFSFGYRLILGQN